MGALRAEVVGAWGRGCMKGWGSGVPPVQRACVQRACSTIVSRLCRAPPRGIAETGPQRASRSRFRSASAPRCLPYAGASAHRRAQPTRLHPPGGFLGPFTVVLPGGFRRLAPASAAFAPAPVFRFSPSVARGTGGAETGGAERKKNVHSLEKPTADRPASHPPPTATQPPPAMKRQPGGSCLLPVMHWAMRIMCMRS